MNRWQIAIKSLFYFRRTNLAIALGVAAATAVLTGALIVGDSMRYSLRELTLERLGMIDEMLLSDGFFDQSLAETLQETAEFKENYKFARPAILLVDNGAASLYGVIENLITWTGGDFVSS